MQNQSIEYLTSRLKQLEKINQYNQERITQLETQNQQLMGIVVQASHHSINRTNQFIQKIQRLVMSKIQCPKSLNTHTIRLKTQHTTTKKQQQKLDHKSLGKENQHINKNDRYTKLKKKQLFNQMQKFKRIQKKLL